jgi:hypothetical protein
VDLILEVLVSACWQCVFSFLHQHLLLNPSSAVQLPNPFLLLLALLEGELLQPLLSFSWQLLLFSESLAPRLSEPSLKVALPLPGPWL